jgi:outer membrane protein OmpA-like peptidoglycan-associated protein
MRFACLLAVAGLAGCVTFVEPSGSLEQARALYRQVAADPQVQLRAPVELSIAERTLGQAERSWRDKAPEDLVAHQTYLASQQARIAAASAQYRAAEAKIATAREQRTRLVLEARQREAVEAKSAPAIEPPQAEVLPPQAEASPPSAEEAKAEPPPPGPDLGAELAKLQSEVAGLKARQTERGWVLTLRNEALFAGGTAMLKPGAARAVDNLARFLRDNPDRDIAIEGFTDSTGSSEANRRLSERRAEAVKQALVGRGIEPRRIDARGYGPSFPVTSNDTPDGRQLNRRVEIIINPS